MMTISDFTEFYNDKLPLSVDSVVSFVESDVSATVKKASLSFKGAHFDYYTENIWTAGVDLYCKESELFRFRAKCDGFAFCTKDDKNYLIWIEIKSGFNEVCKKAIYQIVACYIKMKSYLHTISSYNPSDFQEVAIVVSKPDDDKSHSIDRNSSVSFRRASAVSNEESVEDKYRRKLRQSKDITINATDFGSNKLHLINDILPSNLRVVHCVTTQPDITIDLSTIL